MSTTVPGVDPVAFPSLYDTFLLAGEFSPGRCRFNFPTRVEGWDNQQPKGSRGGESVHNATPLIDFDVEIYIWRDRGKGVDHFARWEAWAPLLGTPVAKNAQKALDIYHPQLDGLNVTSVVVKTWTQPQPDGKGGATVKIKFAEYAPHKEAANGKPNGSKSFHGEKEPPDPNKDLKDKVKKATEDFNDL